MTTSNQSQTITYQNQSLQVPDKPTIPFIEGDGIGADIWKASVRVFDAAVQKAYSGKREIQWKEVYAGEKAFKKTGEWLPQETLDAFSKHTVGIKGPLTTPVGEGFRSLNVHIRKTLDLYVCMRPIRWFKGVPSPVKAPQDVDVIVFRENTEDIYAGIEFESFSAEVKEFMEKFRAMYPDKFDKIRFPDSSGFSLKPISKEGTERIMRAAIKYAMRNKRKRISIVHKGNIMKYTEGAFCKWAYELAEKEFGDSVITQNQWMLTTHERREKQAREEKEGASEEGKIIINDVIADIALQRVLTRPKEFDIIATTNLNGDYLSDAIAAQVGGIGIAPGGNINFETGIAVFEATHGTAPKYSNKNMVNPSSVILSGEMMLRYMGWDEAADLINKGLGGAIRAKKVTYDLHRLMDGGIKVGTSEFGDEIIRQM